MSFKTMVLATATAFAFCQPLSADDMTGIMVQDPYARASTGMSSSGAAFMVLMNHSGENDRLVSASSDAAERVELHTHKEDADGVMRMMQVEEGFVIPAGGMHALARGGDHVMFLGLKHPLKQGDKIEVTLTFEQSGEVTVEVPVDLTRKPGKGMQHQHGQMKKKSGS